MNEISYSDENKGYFAKVSQFDARCTHCNRTIRNQGIMMVRHQRQSEIEYTCMYCTVKIKFSGARGDTMLVFRIEEHLPLDSVPLLKVPFELKSTNITVIDAVGMDTQKFIDKTKLAGRESWEGATVGFSRPQITTGNALLGYVVESKINCTAEDRQEIECHSSPGKFNLVEHQYCKSFSNGTGCQDYNLCWSPKCKN